MEKTTIVGFVDELDKIATKPKKIKSNARMVPATGANVSALQRAVEEWDSPHRVEAVSFMNDISPKALFEVLHSTRRWYSGQTMGHKLREHNVALQKVMKLSPDDVTGIYRGFKVPNTDPLATVAVGDKLRLPIVRNRGLSSWSSEEAPTHRFSGGGKGKTGLVVKLVDPSGVKPLLAPPEKTSPWFNALYEHVIGKSFRPTENEYLIEAPEVFVEVVRKKR